MSGVPAAIGPYRILRRLGAGGMGVVWEAHHPGLGRSVAIKQLQGTVDPRALERFRREGELLSRLRHPGVVAVLELGGAPEGPFLVQELVAGESLDKVLRRGPLPVRPAARIVRDVADALAAVHAAGMLHRDLKPHNVILRPDGTPVLIDFGLARDEQAERLTRTGEVMGSLAYMSPEQADGSKLIDARSDVYGLGAVLYELLTGAPPFQGTTLQVIADILARDPPWPAELRQDVPPDLDAVCRRAMAKQPEARYPTAGALRDDLDRFLRGLPPEGAPWHRRRGLLGAGVGAVLALAGLLLAVALLRPGRPVTPAPQPAPTQSPAPPPLVPAPAPLLWAVPAGRALDYELRLEDQVGVGLIRFQAGLRMLPAGSPEEERLPFACEVLEVVCHHAGELGIAADYDSSRPVDPLNPLAALDAVKGLRFQVELDRRTGAVRSMRGWDGVADLPGAFVRLCNDDFIRSSMHALTCVSGPLTTPWEPAGEGEWTAAARDHSAMLASLFNVPPAGAVFQVEGRCRYGAGRLIEARVSLRGKTDLGLRRCEWSMTLAR